MTQQLTVQAWEDPIRGDPTVNFFEPGATILSMAAGVKLHNEKLRPYLEARINGHVIYKRYWKSKPKLTTPGHPVYVTFHVALHGGKKGGGGGKLLSAIAAIALLGVAFLAPGGFFAIGGLFQAGSLSAKILGTVASIAASLLLQGIQPAPEKSDKVKQLGYAGATNAFEPEGQLQRVLGTRRVVPKVVIPPFREIVDNDEFVYVGFGLAGEHEITEVRLGEARIETAEDVDIEIRPGKANDTHQTTITDTRIESDVQISLSEWKVDEENEEDGFVPLSVTVDDPAPFFHRMQAKRDPDKVKFELASVSGLAFVGDTGKTAPAGIFLRLRMRRSGETDWIYLPDMGFAGKEESTAVRLTLELDWVNTIPPTAGNGWLGHGMVGGSGDVNTTGWRDLNPREGDSIDLVSPNGAGDGYALWEWSKRKIILYLLKATYPQGRYEFEAKRSFPLIWERYNIVTDKGYTYLGGAVTYDFFAPVNIGGVDGIPNNPASFHDDVVITTIQSIWNEYPIADTGNPVALLMIKAKNRRLDKISCLASGKIDTRVVSSGGSLTATTPVVSSSPAAQYYHVLTGIHNAEPVVASLIDLLNLADWYDWALYNGHQVNAVIEDMSVMEVLQLIAMCGWASPVFSPIHSVTIERARLEGPVGLISQRNAAGFSFIKPFSLRSHGVRINFEDRFLDYEVRTITVFAPGYNEDGSGGLIAATRYEDVNYQGLTSEAENRDRAALDILWAKYRSRLIGFKQDIEHLEWRRGSLVLLETDIVGQWGGRGRIIDVEVASSNQGEVYDEDDILDVHDVLALEEGVASVTAITLDEEPDFGDAENDVLTIDDVLLEGDITLIGADRGVSIRLKDGTIVTAEVASYEGLRLVFASPVPANIVVGQLAVTGPLTQTAREVLIWEITPEEDLTASITVVDYAAAQFYS